MSSSSLLPPRKKNWTPGKAQTGVFLRTPEGGTIERVCEDSTPLEVALSLALIVGAHQLSPELQEQIQVGVYALMPPGRIA